ncbi:MAG: hypothetical protein EA398_04245 [Deltaproteobacteria bacterium]|nr:MAG: hypothetical protein EA398_04245 [Deltaproteobacteria bacterium]
MFRPRVPCHVLATPFFVLALAHAGCVGDERPDPTFADSSASSAESSGVEPSDVGSSSDPGVTGSMSEDESPDCDPIHRGACALPWPSNLYLASAPERTTGVELRFGETTLPANRNGVHVSPDPYRRMDGYGLGSAIILFWPDLDHEASDLPRQDDLGASIAEDAPVVLLRVDQDGTLERVPYFAEIDVHPATSGSQRSLYIRPAVILEEGTRYVVGVRNLVDTAGDPITPEPAFVALRDGETANDPQLSDRQERFTDLLDILEDYGVDRGEWIVAWDFVTASSDGLHGYMLSMRDRAFDLMPEGAELEILELIPEPNADEFMRVELRYRTPRFTRQAALSPGSSQTWYVLNLGEDGRPTEVRESGEFQFSEGTVYTLIPRSVLDGEPHGLMLYGHGLLGSGSQTYGGYNRRIANDHRFIYFGIDMLGMSSGDVAAVLRLLPELSQFPWLADRLHQGVIDSVLVARGMATRFDALLRTALENSDLFETPEDVPAVNINSDELVYSGISQGGIFGVTVVAVSPDIRHGHMGVPGNNYSTLLHRSSNFTTYLIPMQSSYRNAVDRAILLSTIQLLWDGSDPVSYMHRASGRPFPGQEASRILLAPVRGDYQVEVQTNEFAVRSGFGIDLLENYDVDRTPWGITPVSYPHEGSGVVLWNYGNPWPPASANAPPQDDLGDPHGAPRFDPEHGRQLAHFLRTGEIIDVCEGAPCLRGAALD